MAHSRYKLRSVVPMSRDGVPGQLLTFDPVGGEGRPVVIHLTDRQYEDALIRFPLERLAEETARRRELEDPS